MKENSPDTKQEQQYEALTQAQKNSVIEDLGTARKLLKIVFAGEAGIEAYNLISWIATSGRHPFDWPIFAISLGLTTATIMVDHALELAQIPLTTPDSNMNPDQDNAFQRKD